MNVISNAKVATVYNLIDGTVFRYGSDYYIKSTDYDCITRRCLCVNLSNGETLNISDSTVVEFYEAEVTLLTRTTRTVIE